MQIRFIRTLLLVLLTLCVSAASFAQIGVSIMIAPPPLPVYEQPLCPEDGYMWTPGYWAYGDDFDDYYWVPGTWVMAPEVGFLWTPGYWGWGGESFVFYEGYWGPQVGFYGGISYGFGYFGEGYEGGRWDNGQFFYNRSVNNVNETVVHNVYNTTVINNTNDNHLSYNGGNGGINARPTPQQEAAAHERHIPPVAVQTQHAQASRTNPQQRAAVNMGKPPVAATPKPGVLNDRAVVPAKAAGAPYTPPANRGGNQRPDNASAPANPAPRPENSAPRPENNASRPNTPVHPHDLQPAAQPSAPNTGNPKLDQKYQQQQEKVFAKQEQERQKLQQQQDREHQRLMQQNANEATKQQVEHKHQQQTQQLQQKHEQQQQQLQQKQQPPNRDRSKPPN
jgi:WXXGXW repeat (2 copies)